MNVNCLYDKLVPVSELKQHPKNRNAHPKDQVERLAKILKYQGWRYPIKVSKQSGFITSGHGRLEAAIENGWPEVPVNYQDYENETQEYADLQADNAIASWSDLDLSKINTDLSDLGPDFDLDMLGIKDFVLEPADKLDPGCDEDEVPEKVEPKTKLGDIYSLGAHRLMCGDSTSIDAVEKLMNGQKADMVFTDPPYGMNLNTNFQDIHKGAKTGKNHAPVIGDSNKFDPSCLFTVSSKDRLVWGADYFIENLPIGGSWYVWDKTVGRFEGRIGNEFELLWTELPHKRLVFRHEWVGYNGLEKEDTKTRGHPNQKPVELLCKILDQFKHDNILDLFGGSGSTLIACEKTNRKCFMMELDPHYCDVIVARWEKFTGQTADLLNG